MDTTALTITLSEPMQAFLAERVAASGYSNPSEYLDALLRETQKHQAEQDLEALLLQGLKGQSTELSDQWWEQFRQRLVERHQKAKGA